MIGEHKMFLFCFLMFEKTVMAQKAQRAPLFLVTTRLLFPFQACLLNKNYRKKSSPTQAVYSKLNFYKGTKGLYHISTNFDPQLIIKQSLVNVHNWEMNASLVWIMIDNEFYTPKLLISEVPSHFIFFKCYGK